jgi:hypothetical protein
MHALCMSHVKIYTYCMYINEHFENNYHEFLKIMYALCVSHVKIYTYYMYINKHFPQIQIIFCVICWGPCKSQKIWNIANVRK